MSILIVGGAGYIGSQTAKRVAQAGLTPVVFDNLVYGHKWAVKWGPLVEGDLADGPLIKRVLEQHAVTAVVHFAAYAYVGESVTNPRKYFRNNVAGTLNLLDAMVDAGVRDIVFSSTCATYGEPVRVPIDEDHPQRPGQPVRRDQAGDRDACCTGTQRAYGLRFAALRYFNAAGADPDGEVGEDHDPETHLIPLGDRGGAGSARASRSSAPTTRRPTERRSATTSTCRIWPTRTSRRWTSCATARRSLFVNLGTGRGHSVREVIAAVEKVSGKQGPGARGRPARRRSAGAGRRRAARRRGPGLEGAHSEHRNHRRARLALEAEAGASASDDAGPASPGAGNSAGTRCARSG